MIEEKKLPDKFRIKIENNNGKEIIDFLVNKGYNNNFKYKGGLTQGYYGYDASRRNYIQTCELMYTTKGYTLSEFKKLFEKEKQYEYKVVHCTTQEEWNFVLDRIKNPLEVIENSFKNYNNICINIITGTYERLEWYQNHNSKIYSFKEWCEEFNHEFSILEYKHSPFPDYPYFTARVTKDIVKKDLKIKGCLPEIIPKGSITWFGYNVYYDYFIKDNYNNTIHPEGNKYAVNIPVEYFEIIEIFNNNSKEEELKNLIHSKDKEQIETKYTFDDMVKKYNNMLYKYTPIAYSARPRLYHETSNNIYKKPLTIKECENNKIEKLPTKNWY